MTIVVLGAITAASFSVWTLPQGSTISVSDYGEYLDRAQQINQVVVDGIDNNFQVVVDGIDNNFQMLASVGLDVEEYVDDAKTSSAQLRSELIQMMQVGVPEQWAESYQKLKLLYKASIEYDTRSHNYAAEKIAKGRMQTINTKAEDVRKRADETAMEVNFTSRHLGIARWVNR